MSVIPELIRKHRSKDPLPADLEDVPFCLLQRAEPDFGECQRNYRLTLAHLAEHPLLLRPDRHEKMLSRRGSSPHEVQHAPKIRAVLAEWVSAEFPGELTAGTVDACSPNEVLRSHIHYDGSSGVSRTRRADLRLERLRLSGRQVRLAHSFRGRAYSSRARYEILAPRSARSSRNTERWQRCSSAQ